MPRSLQFRLDDEQFECEIKKIDRSKLYGSIDITTSDLDGARCTLATLANDGKTLIPYGGTAFGYVNPDGDWVTRSELVPVDVDGNKLESVDSSFDNPVTLTAKASEEDFLNHSIRLSYALHAKTDFGETFLKRLDDGEIFKFPFSYRGGVSQDPAFVLKGADDTVWLLIGSPSSIDFVGLEQAAICVATQDRDSIDDEDDEDDLDFGML